jgi:hypothetical protein
VKYLSVAPLKGRLLASPTNIRLGWKVSPGKNTLAYNEHLQIMTVKSFIALAPGANPPTAITLNSEVFKFFRILPQPKRIRLFCRGGPGVNCIKLFCL